MIDKIAKFFLNDVFHAMCSGASGTQFELEVILLDGITFRMLEMILNEALIDSELCAKIPRKIFVNKNYNKFNFKIFTHRLKVLAQYGLIKVDTSNWISSNRRSVQKIYIHPMWKIIFLKGKHREKKDFIRWFLTVGNNREYGDQGFDFTVEYGKPETIQNKLAEITDYTEVIQEKQKQHKDKQEEKKYWDEKKDDWIKVAAELWKLGQQKNGLGNESPMWSEPTHTLTASAKRERSELMKIFEQYGGKISFLAWNLFNVYMPDLNESGSPRYTTNEPWKQYVFEEKRPMQFSKNFMSLIKSKEFRTLATKDWDTVVANAQSDNFAHILNVEPRFLGIHELLGYSFGQKTITEVNVNV